ncbi:MAG TPA: VacB/RNase II family 3'-5' exoribonuclease [Clostridiaceae bacterium]|nr:VacB/RNase II family 3'-5' exoribonuclease [Clostridiaceae bacterium]
MNNENMSTFVGVLREDGPDGVVILDRYDPEIGNEVHIRRRHFKGAPFGMKVVVEPLYQQKRKFYGKIVEVLGNPEEPDVAVLGIIRRYGLAVDFPTEVLAEAKAIPQELSVDTIARELAQGRIDHREQKVITIDGLDAKDLDDAVYLEKNATHFILWVHIADVSHYVKPGSMMDVEASRRGNSVYLPNLVLPMLPPQISNGIASLHPEVDRLTVTCRLQIQADGTVTGGEVYPSIINSRARLSYEEVEPFLKDQAELQSDRPQELKAMLLAMRECAEALRNKRRRRGTLEFEFPETKIDIDQEGKPVNVRRAEIGISNQIIEEFMIATNEYIAAITSQRKLPAIYRVHDTPDPDKLQQFQHLSFQLGLDFRLSKEPRPAEVAKILTELKGKTYEPTLSTVLLRAMAKAEYSADNNGHFALAAEDYLHFTAPIRRYSDLVTHRALKIKQSGRRKLSRAKLMDISRHVSTTERNSEAAERDTTTYMVALYLSDHIGSEYEGVVSSFNSAAIYVQLDNTAEGAILYRTLPDYYSYLEEELAARNETTGEIMRIGDKVRVRLVKVDLNLLQIDFELLRHDSGTGITGKSKASKAGRGDKRTRRSARKRGRAVRGNHAASLSADNKNNKSKKNRRKKSATGLTRSQKAKLAKRKRQRAERQKIKEKLRKESLRR